MMNRIVRVSLAFVVAALLSATASAADRPAKQILDDLHAIKAPERPDPKDDAAVKAFVDQLKQNDDSKANLIRELYRSHPEDPMVPTLLPERWALMLHDVENAAGLVSEIDEALEKYKDEKLKVEGSGIKAFYLAATGSDAALAAIGTFAAVAPRDSRIANCLYVLASRTDDEARKTELEDRIIKDFPESAPAKSVGKVRQQRKLVGKPFALEFTDAVTGHSISTQELKGKVIVVDFWATWCGPCVAEMPRMKKLYAEFKDQGVEFIGISLDVPAEEGGLDKLKAFVAKHEITWPQYYQGNGWESDFSTEMGIGAIPQLFLIDGGGKLASIDARGKLETLIPEYLEKVKAASSSR